MNRQAHSGLPNHRSPYEVMFGRKPRWTDRVPTHIRHMTEILTEQEETEGDDNITEDDMEDTPDSIEEDRDTTGGVL